MGTVFVAVSGGGTIHYSSDGINWSKATWTKSVKLNCVKYINNKFWVVGDSGTMVTSADGSTWSTVSEPTGNNLTRIAYGNGKYLVGDANGRIYSSANGGSWTVGPVLDTTTPTKSVAQLDFLNGYFYLLIGQTTYRAADAAATAWTPVLHLLRQFKTGLVWEWPLCVHRLHQGANTSVDGVNFSTQSRKTSGSMFAMAFGDGKFVAVGASGVIGMQQMESIGMWFRRVFTT